MRILAYFGKMMPAFLGIKPHQVVEKKVKKPITWFYEAMEQVLNLLLEHSIAIYTKNRPRNRRGGFEIRDESDYPRGAAVPARAAAISSALFFGTLK